MNRIQFEALKGQGLKALSRGDLVTAKRSFAALLPHAPGDIDLAMRLAEICNTDGDLDLGINVLMQTQDAVADLSLKVKLLEKACEICQRHQKNNYGLVPAERWVHLQAENPQAQFYLGLFSFNTRFIPKAVRCYRKALELDTNNPQIHLQLGKALAHSREAEEALEQFDIALARKPKDPQVNAAVLYASNWLEGLTEEEIFKRHRGFGQRLEKKVKAVGAAKRQGQKSSRIRVGYLSGDFYHHSVSYFFLPLIEGVDKKRFEVFCYNDGPYRDELTERIQASAEHWEEVNHLDRAQLVRKIKLDGIDILVDLTGYAGKFRLDVFASRAAPVQVSYLGYPNTTGLQRMDYRITDAWADPPGKTEVFHSEKLVRMPSGFLCFQPYYDVPVADLPALAKKSKGICFGSFNSFQKITSRVLDTWAEILNRVEDSRLLVKAIALQDDEAKENLKRFFVDKGVAEDRLELFGWTQDKVEHLKLYAKVDLHLDTFPYNGTTTTCEALWQGVPTLTFTGESHRSRVSASILQQVGLADFIAQDRESYIELAVEKASDKEALSALRKSLRNRVSGSTLMDKQRFNEELAAVYMDMYQRHSGA